MVILPNVHRVKQVLVARADELALALHFASKWANIAEQLVRHLHSDDWLVESKPAAETHL